MIWQISEGFLKLTIDIETAKRLFILTQSGTLILVASCLYFSLLFTKKINDTNRAVLYFLTYLPALFFIIANVLQWTNNEYTYSDSFGFIDTSKSTLFSIEVLYLSVVGIITMFVFINYWIKQRTAKARIIAIGFSVPFIQGLITEMIFPELLNIPPIPLTTTSITVFSIASIIAFKKYKLLSFSPYKVSDNIIKNMSDAIIISDDNHYIKYINPAAIRMLGYYDTELINKRAQILVADNESDDKVLKMLEATKNGASDKYEVNLTTKYKDILTVIISSSPYYEKNKIVGNLSLIHDITNEKKQVKELTAAMISGEEKERQRLAFELHDGVSQSIAGINMKLQSLKSTLIVEENELILDDIIKSTKESITEIRNLSHNLYPLNEDEFLCDALSRLISRHKNIPLKFELNVKGNKPLINNPTITTNAYRVLQEFINNTIKYANASLVSINVFYHKTEMEIKIEDDGCGFDLNTIKDNDGIGLNNMQKRIEVIGGTFSLTSKLNIGTKLDVKVPISY
jgi:PAS domain S-box-containing protein